MVKTIVISSTNKGKIAEIAAIFRDLPVEVASFEAVTGTALEVVEDGQTFEENAIKKVVACPSHPDRIYLGDDSGLMVDALDGAPGIYSARYAGPGATAESASRKLLGDMAGKSDRKAHFVSCLALKFPDGQIHTALGELHGEIAYELAGEYGFGFDPVFVPSGFSQTLAQMGPEKKNQISHRYLALQKARDVLYNAFFRVGA